MVSSCQLVLSFPRMGHRLSDYLCEQSVVWWIKSQMSKPEVPAQDLVALVRLLNFSIPCSLHLENEE